jgi:molybdate transport system substrate-binding protein
MEELPMKRLFIWLLTLLVPFVMELRAETLRVFAAASLTDALKEIATGFEKETTNKVVFNFGASSTLARQIEEGAPADVFFSADEAKMDGLEKKSLILKEARKTKLSNALVIVVTSDSTLTVSKTADLTEAKVKRIALADPKTVPAGVYAKEYLTKLKLWSAIEHKVVPTDNVRACLAAVESGNVEVGIVYKTDAAISKKVKIAYEVPKAESPDISYPIAMVTEAKQPEAAKTFLRYLESDTAKNVFVRFGFIVRP